MTETAADLLVRIDATTESLRRELARADRAVASTDRTISNRLRSVEQSFTKASRVVSGLAAGITALAGAAAVRSLGRLGRQALTAADDVQTTANAVGVSTTALQTFKFTAEEVADVSAPKAAEALERFARRVGSAALDDNALADTLRGAGVALRDFEGNVRPTEAILFDFADAVQNAATQQERLALVQKTLGREFQGAVNIFAEGAAGLRRYGQQGRELGRILDDEVVAKGAAASDQLQRIERSARSAFQAGVVEGFTGELDDLDGALVEISRTARSFGENLGGALAFVAENAGAVMSRLEQVGRIAAAIGGAGFGLRVGGRFGPLGALGGAGVGAVGGTITPEAMP
jgi:hypothetical protein